MNGLIFCAGLRCALPSLRGLCVTVVSLFIMLATTPAKACMTFAPFEPDDIKYADIVVIGRIKNYRIVPDQIMRQYLKEHWPTETHEGVLSDYARFDVVVDEVLVGNPEKIISVTWDNSTFSEPEKMEEGPFLIALRKPNSKMPPLRGSSATIRSSPDIKSLTVLQAPCAPAFILEATSVEAKNVRNILSGSPPPPQPLPEPPSSEELPPPPRP